MDDLTSSSSNLLAVKQENYKFLCSSCLSQNRKVSPLEENIDLFVYLSGSHHVKDREILLCWECRAILRKIHMFQQKVQCAQKILEQAVCLDESIVCLSTLGVYKQNDTQTITEQNRKRKQKKAPDCEKDVKEPRRECFQRRKTNGILKLTKDHVQEETIAIKEEITNESNDITDFDNNDFNYETDNEIKKEICLEKINDAHFERKPKIRKKTKIFGIKEYRDAVKIRKSDIDINNFDGYFEKFILTEEIVEQAGRVIDEDKIATFKINRTCKPCRKVFQNNLEHQEHKTYCHILKEKKGKESYKCLRCRLCCKGQAGLRAHWREEHSETMRCKLCGYRTQMHKTEPKATHIRTHQYRWICKLCTGVVFDVRKDFLRHYKELHKYCYCDGCGHRFRRKSRLVLHVAVCQSSLHCAACNIQYRSLRSFASHVRARHAARLAPHVPPAPRDAAYCVECDKQFHSPDLYRRHLYASVKHNPDFRKRHKNTSCPECGKTYTRTIYMKRHLALVHAKKTKFRCEVCSKYLSSNFALRKHIMGVHHKIREPRNKVCEICGRGFQTNAILRHHRRTHTGERPHACPHCRAAFAQKYALQTHMRSQHKAQS